MFQGNGLPWGLVWRHLLQRWVWKLWNARIHAVHRHLLRAPRRMRILDGVRAFAFCPVQGSVKMASRLLVLLPLLFFCCSRWCCLLLSYLSLLISPLLLLLFLGFRAFVGIVLRSVVYTCRDVVKVSFLRSSSCCSSSQLFLLLLTLSRFLNPYSSFFSYFLLLSTLLFAPVVAPIVAPVVAPINDFGFSFSKDLGTTCIAVAAML